ncbi:uncharacterized protein BT62DRAFT_925297 [Guyanagaster necrorhizus]|uniref:Uncharacterized protein n=1 Tax=Guyanagaster necrorhizus TaxID=856835 RepID=A0A9P7W5X9_9AGAR|nr:uncharacterized protein BT62DRAFT_925297 [Guyanagaster necrorhizus MCA 3950]KAG7452757.1 hypothetical protein BT62DRAFT_925297 [Guyanagaster necrorhizus MCA 3950]
MAQATWRGSHHHALMGALGLGIYEASSAPSRSFPVYFQDGQVVYPQLAYPFRTEIIPIYAAALIAFFAPLLLSLSTLLTNDLLTTTMGLLKSFITAAVLFPRVVPIRWARIIQPFGK